MVVELVELGKEGGAVDVGFTEDEFILIGCPLLLSRCRGFIGDMNQQVWS